MMVSGCMYYTRIVRWSRCLPMRHDQDSQTASVALVDAVLNLPMPIVLRILMMLHWQWTTIRGGSNIMEIACLITNKVNPLISHPSFLFVVMCIEEVGAFLFKEAFFSFFKRQNRKLKCFLSILIFLFAIFLYSMHSGCG
ncbi:hypothetical protein Ancab_014580 [Ancistrocladus abbreviatus]